MRYANSNEYVLNIEDFNAISRTSDIVKRVYGCAEGVNADSVTLGDEFGTSFDREELHTVFAFLSQLEMEYKKHKTECKIVIKTPLRLYYEDYLCSFEREYGSLDGAQTYEEFCSFNGVDELTPIEDLRRTFWYGF